VHRLRQPAAARVRIEAVALDAGVDERGGSATATDVDADGADVARPAAGAGGQLVPV